ncbi:uncharacterized protein LOC143181855 [Calliopsis andreniformis]|uniref:uncharacterized protein LOC143181855 n=1 Tax=Calliopsis andreniformis TaxID=337506 RepID=UPI003FCD2AF9
MKRIERPSCRDRLYAFYNHILARSGYIIAAICRVAGAEVLCKSPRNVIKHSTRLPSASTSLCISFDCRAFGYPTSRAILLKASRFFQEDQVVAANRGKFINCALILCVALQEHLHVRPGEQARSRGRVLAAASSREPRCQGEEFCLRRLRQSLCSPEVSVAAPEVRVCQRQTEVHVQRLLI